MDEKERITNPSMGSNELGTETNEGEYSGVSAGSDTQLHLASAGGKKHTEQNKTNDDLEKEKNKAEFLERNQTDE